MQALSSLDYGIIGLFLVVTVVAGFWMTRRAAGSLDDYFLGGRSIPWYFLGISGMAAWFDLTGTMIITSFLYMLGPRGLYIEFRGGAVLVLAFMVAYTGKWHHRSGCMTGAEWLVFRFGKDKATNALRLLSAFMGVVGTIGMLAYLVRGTSLFMGMFFPWPPMTMTFILIGLTAIYTMCSGFYGVVLTDVVQSTIILISCLVVAFMAWHQVPDSAALAETARQVTGNVSWTDSMLAWKTTMPKGYEIYQSLTMFAAFYLLRNVLGGMGSGGEGRYFGARNDRECGLQSMFQGITVAFRWPMMIGFAVMGIYLIARELPNSQAVENVTAVVKQMVPDVTQAHWHDVTSSIVNSPEKWSAEGVAQIKELLGDDWQKKLPVIGFHGVVNPEQILPMVLMRVIPAGLKGVLIMAMLAAMMSTLNTAVNGTGALIVRDFYQNLIRPEAKNRELIAVSWISSLAIVAAGCWMGVSAGSINELWGWIIMSLGAGGLAPGLLRLYWWRCNTWGMFMGTLLGGIGAVLQKIFMPEMTEGWQFLTMGCLSFIGTIGGSLLTKPTNREVLENFYKTTRPFGFWGPLKSILPDDVRTKMEAEHRNDILTIPFALLAQVTLFLLAMQVVIKAYSSMMWTLPLFLIGVIGLRIFWWKPLWKLSDK